MNILLIEPDPLIADFVQESLRVDKHRVKTINDGLIGFKLARTGRYDLLIIDSAPLNKNGLEICSELRRLTIGAPIIIVSSDVHEDHIVKALDSGADDFLAKPFSHKVLCARVRAITRRPSLVLQSELEIGKLKLSPANRKVRRGSKIINLRPKEYQLLEYMMRNPNVALSREKILLDVWGLHTNNSSNRLEVHIRYLRKKIDDSSGKTMIVTVRNVGYMFDG